LTSDNNVLLSRCVPVKIKGLPAVNKSIYAFTHTIALDWGMSVCATAIYVL